MMSKGISVSFLVVLGGVAAMALEIGEAVGPLPLTTLEEHRFEMTNYGEQRASVVVFLSSRCEATEQQIGVINKVHGKYRLRDVLFVGICPNAAESPEDLRAYAHRRGCIFPVYLDPDGKAAARLGAQVTPEAFLIGRDGVLRYRGAVSATNDGTGGLEAAVRDLLADRPVAVSNTPATGTSIGSPGPAREIDDHYGFLSFSSELIFERIPGAAVYHCSTLAEAANGNLVCVWYGGSYESAEDQVLFLSRRPKGERRWSAPEVVVRNPGQPPGNAVVFRDGAGRLWIVWGRMEGKRPIRRGSGWGECRLMYRTSEDHGVTWSADQEFQGLFGALQRNVPITRKTGELLLPLSGQLDGAHGSFFLATADNGITWTRSAVAPGGGQPTIIERNDGSLFMMMRHQPRILQSESSDGGQSWLKPVPSEFKNPDAGIAMWRLANGHAVLVFNDTTTSRTPLSVARSVDEGRTWGKPVALESNPGEYSYPCVIQTADGQIHVTYTCRRYAIKHVEFNEEWLTNFERPD